MFAFDHDHHAEFAPDGEGAIEQFFDLLRPGVRGDVVILRLASEQKIAHAAADPERRETRGLQAADDFNGSLAWCDRVSFAIYDIRFTGRIANRSRRCQSADEIRVLTKRLQFNLRPRYF